jgi:hypothetical protein
MPYQSTLYSQANAEDLEGREFPRGSLRAACFPLLDPSNNTCLDVNSETLSYMSNPSFSYAANTSIPRRPARTHSGGRISSPNSQLVAGDDGQHVPLAGFAAPTAISLATEPQSVPGTVPVLSSYSMGPTHPSQYSSYM